MVLSEAANECGWSRRVRSGDAQREARCDAGSECGGESPATEALSEAGGADCMELCVCVGSRFGERLDGHQTTVTPLLTPGLPQKAAVEHVVLRFVFAFGFVVGGRRRN